MFQEHQTSRIDTKLYYSRVEERLDYQTDIILRILGTALPFFLLAKIEAMCILYCW